MGLDTRSSGAWAEQVKLVGDSRSSAGQGSSVAVSAYGTLAMVGGSTLSGDESAWLFTRNGGAWSQRGNKLMRSDAIGTGARGVSVAVSADGATAMMGGRDDNSKAGATWVFTL
jgi:hypothetical protein